MPSSRLPVMAILVLALLAGPASLATARPVEPVPHPAALPAVVVPTAAQVPARSPAPREGEWPLVPRPTVLRGFDPPDERWGSGHRGVDLAGRPGQTVRTSLGGRVSFAGLVAGRWVVSVDHGGRRTTYQPVLPTVRQGDEVAAGAPLGRLLTAGGHCLPATCLHWGLLRGSTYLDPLTLVDAPRPVRLLPAQARGWASR